MISGQDPYNPSLKYRDDYYKKMTMDYEKLVDKIHNYQNSNSTTDNTENNSNQHQNHQYRKFHDQNVNHQSNQQQNPEANSNQNLNILGNNNSSSNNKANKFKISSNTKNNQSIQTQYQKDMTTNQIEKNRDDRNGPRCSNRSNENSCSNSADIDYHYNKDDRLNFDPQPTFSKTPLATNKANTNCIRRKSEAQPK